MASMGRTGSDVEADAPAAGRPNARGMVLVVEDDPTVAEIVVRYLERDGFLVEWRSDGGEGLRCALDLQPDLVVLDLMLPSLDGLEICRRLHHSLPIPVVMLTARGDESDRILGLELGADDYLTKPFSPRELVARVNAVLRRAEGPIASAGAGRLRAGGLVIDVGAREVTRHGEHVVLTAREFDLLAHLATHPREAFRREDLLESVWGYTYGDAATVTVHIRRLREKVEQDPSSPRLITTVWGVGYRWDG
jgi:DNA-binding response OmpR family regulator